MRTRAEMIVVLAVLASGCGGKLLGSGDGNGVGTGSSGVASCDGDAGSFVGAWTCQLTTDPIGPSVPGVVQSPLSGTRSLTFAEGDGGLSMTLGPPPGWPDAGDGTAPTCTLSMTATDNTATLEGQPSCWDELDSNDDQYTSGTFTVSGCSATLSNLVGSGRVYSTQWYATEGRTSGTCTRD